MKWIKFDLHQHTCNERLTDRSVYDSTYTHRKFRELIIEQGVKLKSVTNHNSLHIADHIKYSLICESVGVSYLPGVEIDYKFDEERIQAISVLNPKSNIIEFSNKLESIIYDIPKDENITINKQGFADLHENCEFIFIPHYCKDNGIKPTSDSLLEKEQNWVLNMIKSGNTIPVIFENTQEHHKYTVYGMLKDELEGSSVNYSPSYTGTDYKFDNDDERKLIAKERLIYVMDAEPTYRGLEIAIRHHEQRISSEKEIFSRNNYIHKIEFNDNDNFGEINSIELSPSLNVIIGSSGSGKTLLLNEIFFQTTRNTLSDVLDTNKSVNGSKKRPYLDKIGSNDWLELTYKHKNRDLNIIEIPNIYSKLLRNMNEPTTLGEIFGIADTKTSEDILSSFFTKISSYEQNLDKINSSKNNVIKYLDSLNADIHFLIDNPNLKNEYHLTEKNIDLTKKDELDKKMELHNKIVDNEKNINSYLLDISKFLELDDNNQSIQIIKSQLSIIYDQITLKKEEIANEISNEEFENEIKKHVNISIKKRTDALGQRNKQINEKNLAIQKNNQLISKELKKYLSIEKKMENMNIEYPFKIIQNILKEENANKHARYQLSLEVSDLKSIVISDSLLIDSSNILGKLRSIQSRINLLDLTSSQSIKEHIKECKVEQITLSEILNENLNLLLQMNVDNEWRNASEINPGDVSKVSISYYFDDLLSRSNPDVILIDQPENDLDKVFITEVLSDFFRKNKIKQQIIITSHDPILTINSDVNTIIESRLNDEKKICYHQYKIETIDNGDKVTDRVAKILDGSKKNVMNRYNIYGGIKNGN